MKAGCITVLLVLSLFGLFLLNLIKYNSDLSPSTTLAITVFAAVIVLIFLLILIFSSKW